MSVHMSKKKKHQKTTWLNCLQALICNKGQVRTHPLLYLQTWILHMAGHKGLINTSFYFGVGRESESSVVQGHRGAAFCVHRTLQGVNMVQPLQSLVLLPLTVAQ